MNAATLQNAALLRRVRLPHMLLFATIFVLASNTGMAGTLADAYQQAKAHDPITAQSRENLRMEQAEKRIAKAPLLPQALAEINVQHVNQDLSGFSAEPSKSDYIGNQYTVTLTQTLYNSAAWKNYKAAGHTIQAAEATLQAAEQDLVRQVVADYLAVLKKEADITVAESNVHALSEVLAQAEAYLQAGAGEIVSVREAQARLDGARAELELARHSVTLAQKALEKRTRTPLPSAMPLGPFTPLGPQPETMAQWVEAAHENQPLLQEAELLHTHAQERIAIEKRANWPTLGLSLGYTKSKGGFGEDIKDEQITAGFGLNWQLYDGGATQARTGHARAQAEFQKQQAVEVADQIQLNTESAFLALKNSLPILNAQQTRLRSVETQLAATRKGLEVGTRTIIDVLNAEQDLAQAQRDYEQARIDHILARIDLKYAAGVLSEKDLYAIDALLASASSGANGEQP